MKIVIQCAAGKSSNAGHLKTSGLRDILFVAKPELAKNTGRYIYKSPNDISENNITWAEELVKYNNNSANELHLLPSYKLYDNNIYRALVRKFGHDNVFILSAGWGLIKSSFLTPNYNITFSTAKNINKEFIRNKKDNFKDLCHLPLNSTGKLIFLGGKDYQPLFVELTAEYKGKKIIFYNSKNPPEMESCELVKFETKQRTNWHYKCAMKIIEGVIKI